MNIKEANKKIRELKAEIKELDLENDNIRGQRNQHRAFIVTELKAHLEVSGESKYWSPGVVIERIARHMSSQSNWYW